MNILISNEFEASCTVEALFAFATDEANDVEFKGYGPIPGIVRVSPRQPGPCRVGAIYDVLNSDGSRHVEEVLELVPLKHVRREIREFERPLSWLVQRAEERWLFSSTPRGCLLQRSLEFELRSPWVFPLARIVALFLSKAIALQGERVRTVFATRSFVVEPAIAATAHAHESVN